MSTAEHISVFPGYAPAVELEEVVAERTPEITGHRRRTAVIRRRGWLVRRALLLADVVGLFAAFLVSYLIGGRETAGGVPFRFELDLFLLTLPVWVVAAKVYGLYDRDEERTDHSTIDDVVGVFHLVTVGSFLMFAVTELSGSVSLDFHRLIWFWAIAVCVIPIGRAVSRGIARRHVSYQQNTIIVGAGDVGQIVARKLLNHPEYGINLLGFVDRKPKARRSDLDQLKLLGPPERLTTIIRLLDVERIVIAFSGESDEETIDLIRELKDCDVQIDIVPRFFDVVGPGMTLHSVEGLPLIGMPPLRLAWSSRILKRTMDIAFSTVALATLAPVFALVALLIKLDSRGPVFFRQVRMGFGSQTFRIWKFRTMSVDAEERKAEIVYLNQHLAGDARMFKAQDDPRVTQIGRFLRKTSIDELPQLFNVLVGKMSLVGPRPLILDEDAHVHNWARKRLDLKPGITGLWQVLGRSDIPFEEMVKLDHMYVTGWSLKADLHLILRTIPVVVGRRSAC